jgi:Methyl-accepting chemotaxis protein
MTIGKKLALCSLAFSLPIGVMVSLIVSGIRANIDFAEYERAGAAYLKPLSGVEFDLRALARRGRTGAQSASIDEGFKALAVVQAKYGSLLRTGKDALAERGLGASAPEELERSWREAKVSCDPATLRGIADRARALVDYVGDMSKLILDPDLDSYYLMDAVVVALPDYLERLDSSAAGSADASSLVREVDLPRIAADCKKSLEEDAAFYGISPTLQKRLPPAVEALAKSGGAFVAGGASASNAREAALASARTLWEIGYWELSVLLEVRAQKYRADTRSAIELSALALALALGIIVLIGKGIVGQVRDLEAGIGAAGGKDLRAQVRVRSRDELGAAAQKFQGLLAELRRSLRDISSSALRLSDSSSGVKTGSEDLGGATSSLAAGVEQLSASAIEFDRALAQVGESVDRQFSALDAAASEIAEIAAESATGSERAAALLSLSRDNDAAVGASARVIEAAVVDAEDIGGALRGISDRVRRLEAEAQSISSVLDAVRDIAERTSLLAMNAAIEAAHAGASGKGFAVVAGEIRKLSAEATRSIAETSDVFAAIKEAVAEAVAAAASGERLAATVGEEGQSARAALARVESSGKSVAALSDELADLSAGLRARASRASASVGELRDFSAEIRDSLGEQTASARQMSASIEALRGAAEANSKAAAVMADTAGVLAAESVSLKAAIAGYET